MPFRPLWVAFCKRFFVHSPVRFPVWASVCEIERSRSRTIEIRSCPDGRCSVNSQVVCGGYFG